MYKLLYIKPSIKNKKILSNNMKIYCHLKNISIKKNTITTFKLLINGKPTKYNGILKEVILYINKSSINNIIMLCYLEHINNSNFQNLYHF